MSKIAFVFPGQGAQNVGMCKNFYDQYTVARHIFEEADEALGFSITKMCFEGPEDELCLTYNTQPAILTASIACAAVLKQYDICCDVAAGHSLGEYSALVVSEALAFADAVRIVRQRGQFMQEAVPVGEGGMAAVLGMESERIVEICNKVTAENGGIVQAVNFNCPGQVVIAGATAAVDSACEDLKAAGAKRVVQLPVSAPFHSSLMQPASKRLAEALAQITIHDAKIPVIANVTAKEVKLSAEINESLIKQAASPVLWEKSVLNMATDGVDTFIEVGPGKTLTGFTKKIAKGLPALNVEDPESLKKTLEYLKGGKINES
ncbi:MAG: ACP S-malonyltransferase [Phascolarctobacterium sp.]|nr:ACP S-malonyltransferase [Phascolarctobacterium sp.]